MTLLEKRKFVAFRLRLTVQRPKAEFGFGQFLGLNSVESILEQVVFLNTLIRFGFDGTHGNVSHATNIDLDQIVLAPVSPVTMLLVLYLLFELLTFIGAGI